MIRVLRAIPVALIVAACGGSDSNGPAAGFECLGQPLPTTAPALVNLTGQVRTYTNSAISGAGVVAFRVGNATPLDSTTSNTPGQYSIGITTGGTPVDGYLRVTDGTHLPTYAYPAVPLATDITENVLMVSSTEFGVLAAAAGITPVAGKGFIGIVVKNCQGVAIAGAKVSTNPAGEIRYSAAGIPSSTATSTDSTGVAFVANVTAGNVTIMATASGHTLRQHVVNATADAITLTEIQP
jgi:hypothetical protein